MTLSLYHQNKNKLYDMLHQCWPFPLNVKISDEPQQCIVLHKLLYLIHKYSQWLHKLMIPNTHIVWFIKNCWPLCWKFPEGPPQACRRRGPGDVSRSRNSHIITFSITLIPLRISHMDFPGHRTSSHSWRLTISRSTNSASPNELMNPKISMKNQPFSIYSFQWFEASIVPAE